MTDEHDETRPHQLADEMAKDAEEMQERSEDVGEEIGDAAKDWEAKRRDNSEAGAPPPEGEDRGSE